MRSPPTAGLAARDRVGLGRTGLSHHGHEKRARADRRSPATDAGCPPLDDGSRGPIRCSPSSRPSTISPSRTIIRSKVSVVCIPGRPGSSLGIRSHRSSPVTPGSGGASLTIREQIPPGGGSSEKPPSGSPPSAAVEAVPEPEQGAGPLAGRRITRLGWCPVRDDHLSTALVPARLYPSNIEGHEVPPPLIRRPSGHWSDCYCRIRQCSLSLPAAGWPSDDTPTR